ncbi:MAG: two-component system C4-dicarboxylate transport response regulator DctD, partial [Sulfitobacter sp.]
MNANIYIVDDDADHLSALCDLVQTSGFAVRAFASADDALGAMA